MQTKLTDLIKATREGNEAAAIISKCVHCGFCNATCPTYQLLGDELDGPRGRIYLIKQVLEGSAASSKTQLHLDRCLTCRNCETTCPSGVQYGKLIELGRHLVEQQVPRSFIQSASRTAIKSVLSSRIMFTPLLRTGQAMRALLPNTIAKKIPQPQSAGSYPNTTHQERMILLDGCVQPGISPNINAATARVFDRLKIQLIRSPQAGCCGALRAHLNDAEGGQADARRNIDAWLPLLDFGAKALVMTASGCGSMIKEYDYFLSHDPTYKDKAKRVSQATFDVSEILFERREQLRQLAPEARSQQKIVFHPPCSLQHAQKINGKVEQILASVGIEVSRCAESHLCCGSAGTYSILQPQLSTRLRERKLGNLLATEPDRIVSANIGCIAHLQTGTTTPVTHWIELLDQVLTERAPSSNPSSPLR